MTRTLTFALAGFLICTGYFPAPAVAGNEFCRWILNKTVDVQRTSSILNLDSSTVVMAHLRRLKASGDAVYRVQLIRQTSKYDFITLKTVDLTVKAKYHKASVGVRKPEIWKYRGDDGANVVSHEFPGSAVVVGFDREDDIGYRYYFDENLNLLTPEPEVQNLH